MADLNEAVFVVARGLADYRGLTNLELVMPDAISAVLALQAAGYSVKADA